MRDVCTTIPIPTPLQNKIPNATYNYANFIFNDICFGYSENDYLISHSF